METFRLLRNTLLFIIVGINVNAQMIPSVNSSVYNYIPESVKAEIRKNVDWSCNLDDRGDVRRIGDPVKFVTPAGIFNTYRMYTGGRSCANLGILYAMIGQREAGFSWFVATQSHNPGVQNLYSQYADYSLAYAISAYGSKAVREGFATEFGGPIVSFIRSHLRL